MKAINFLILLILIFSISCYKHEKDISFNNRDFPISEGNYWIYSYTDFNAAFTDTFKLQINKIEFIGTDTQKIQFYIFNEQLIIDSAWSYITANTFTYSGNPIFSLFGDFKLSFPFQVGDNWANNAPDDIHVISYSNRYLVSNSNFENVFFLYGYYKRGLVVISNELYLSKGIGIVKKSIQYEDESVTNSRKQIFTLIDYKSN